MTAVCQKLGNLSRTMFQQPGLLLPKHNIFMVPTSTKVTFFEADRKGGYKTGIKLTPKEMWKESVKMWIPELKKFKNEVVTKFRCDDFYFREHQDFEYFEKFDSPESLEPWVVTADSDHLEGKSTANLVLSRHNHALFFGHLSTETPKDGITQRAGYCNIRSPRNVKSFHRLMPYDWSRYTHLVMRIRGDGRPYLFTIGMDMYFDTNWSDQYNFTLYTRGGPYWQTAKVPFSKFFLSAKGRIQDRQQRILLNRVAYFGLTQGDGNEGPFHLEIDYIGLMYDENNDEDFAYETYQVAPFIMGT